MNVLAKRIAAARLQRQFLVTTSPYSSAGDVVRALCAVQSQDYFGAKWAVAMRATGLTERDIDEAFDRGKILRTHVLRPTWHFVTPEDLRWMLALTGPRVAALMASYNRRLGLDTAVFRKSHRVIARALAKHGPMTRQQLKVELDRSGVATGTTQRLSHLVMQAEVDALVCSGPRLGKQFTYALVDQRAPSQRTLTREESLHELTLRYFATRAPATAHDFSWWSGLTVTECRRAIDMAGSALRALTFGDVLYHAPSDFELPSRVPTCAHLLPNYDEYFIGYRNRAAIAQRLRSADIVTGGDALIAHVVAIDGQLVGGWRRKAAPGQTIIDMNLMTALTRSEHARLDKVVKAFAAFVGQPVVVNQQA